MMSRALPDPSNARARRTVRDLERRMAELDRLDREYGLGAMPTARPARPSALGAGHRWPRC